MTKLKQEVQDAKGDLLEIKGRVRAMDALEVAVDELSKRLNATEREQRRLAMEREMDKQVLVWRCGELGGENRCGEAWRRGGLNRMTCQQQRTKHRRFGA